MQLRSRLFSQHRNYRRIENASESNSLATYKSYWVNIRDSKKLVSYTSIHDVLKLYRHVI